MNANTHTKVNATDPVSARLDFLDALRGIAAAYVVLFHLVYVGGVTPPAWLWGFTRQGGSGVMLFFVVSCFSLFLTMPARLREEHPRLSFYMHRFFRIAPLFYVWLLASVLINTYRYNVHNSVSEILQSVFFVFNFVPGNQAGIVMASWTIGVEMLFYAIFPWIYFRTRNLIQASSLVICAFVAYFLMAFVLPLLPLSPETAASYENWFVLKDLPVFSFGAVCYFVLAHRLRSEPGPHFRSVGSLLLFAFAYLMIAFANGWVSNQVFGDNPYAWQAVFYALLLVGLYMNPLRLLVNKVTTFLGTISYSLYLAHARIIVLMQPWFSHMQSHHRSPSKTYLLCVAATFLVAVPISYVTYRLIELPGIKAGKSAYRWIAQLKRVKLQVSKG